MKHRPTVADLLSMKGKRQLIMLRVVTLEEAEAAEKAGIDLVSVPPALLGSEFREAAPTVFAFPGLDDFVTAEDYLRAAFQAMRAGGDAVYCAAGLSTVRRLREEGIPVCGHVGLIPSKATWTGGFRAVGKTAESALEIWRQVKALEEAGAFAAEIEVVPGEVAAAISQRTSLLMLSMGAGTGCDAQYLFAEDVLGQNRGHYPRHAKVYRNFTSELDRLQQERISAFREYAEDVRSGAYPGKAHLVGIAPEELDSFLSWIEPQEQADFRAR
ncbi:3-methyl-2-oxobutanoate hydroxymethyltransferase [Sinorhizobium meliloti]|uniref:3-methyl-2-oxobutanoate hydroxymethyltransferase n=1 Tax=Rhizobium meliloti TaxID=382 RepID=UPI000B4A25BE|nr:3-methyl-2-oxobutanoate hydroxymethyltransferase [Sinorhizobium meliloti]ASQ12722.1 3-methyl-2-oxobutanoate hydroxymethyltransferase [Sinorhizobium meliloti]MDW9372013.1 3-methyl-2-oxobutanoate hydroxymethyltransferase [Sinorhizobium meliloti]MDW9401079.1 3-methyl-2-oxobutanoate hydroxymethyltransferase [Sinorhizobium meliloti]MDW9540344.1 3-methyl-2-oxobutanoate hydroxymethyltransferase [Sinorhizobium meliloti]MDW9551385.1 3-methyl-2-oxobutanoate hydroxymethyltransferase [Sinorhizobium mel